MGDVDARGLDGVTACVAAVRPGSPSKVVKELRERGGTPWADTTLFLGGKTKIDWDTRNKIEPVPLELPKDEEEEEEGDGEDAGVGDGDRDETPKAKKKSSLAAGTSSSNLPRKDSQ